MSDKRNSFVLNALALKIIIESRAECNAISETMAACAEIKLWVKGPAYAVEVTVACTVRCALFLSRHKSPRQMFPHKYEYFTAPLCTLGEAKNSVQVLLLKAKRSALKGNAVNSCSDPIISRAGRREWEKRQRSWIHVRLPLYANVYGKEHCLHICVCVCLKERNIDY